MNKEISICGVLDDPSNCPTVKFSKKGVRIGEDGNNCWLTNEQWNILVDKIKTKDWQEEILDKVVEPSIRDAVRKTKDRIADLIQARIKELEKIPIKDEQMEIRLKAVILELKSLKDKIGADGVKTNSLRGSFLSCSKSPTKKTKVPYVC